MNNHTAYPVQLIWDRPNLEPRKQRWNLLDQLMPQYSCQEKSDKFMSDHFGSPTIKTTEVTQTKTRYKGGVLIEPLEPHDDSDEELALKRKPHGKYQLRFVNNVCETYYTMDPLKADDGSLLKVALFDETNTKITSGPLSSASVEVVALHGDFNLDGQDYWTSEEFSRDVVVSPRPGKEARVIGGDVIINLADGEACLGDAFIQRASLCARTGKFKLGVMLVSNLNNRVHEGISEPFRVRDRDGLQALPRGFKFHPSDEELVMRYLRPRVDGGPCPVSNLGNRVQEGILEPFRVRDFGGLQALPLVFKFHPSEEKLVPRYLHPRVDEGPCPISNLDIRVLERISRPIQVRDRGGLQALPRGFKFHPSDEELVMHYLRPRVDGGPCPVPIAEVDLYKFDPWELTHEATMLGQREWYFFCRASDSNHPPDGVRSAGSGYWEATGSDKPVLSFPDATSAFKKTLAFYTGHAPSGSRTSWVMHEYRMLPGRTTNWPPLELWVLCRIFHTDKWLFMNDDEQFLTQLPAGSSFQPDTFLPPGFRFTPTDEDLVFTYLRNRATAACPNPFIPDVDIHKCEPWNLPAISASRWSPWFFFSNKDLTNLPTRSGYWKATGEDNRTISRDKMLGFRRTLTFYRGRRRAPTNWAMHQYHLRDSTGSNKASSSVTSITKGEWLLCKIFKKLRSSPIHEDDCLHQLLQDDDSLPAIDPAVSRLEAQYSPHGQDVREDGPTADVLS